MPRKTIIDTLNTKSILKQTVYKQTISHFNDFKELVQSLVNEINEQNSTLENRPEVKLNTINDFEFHLKIGGDMLVFLMQTNVFAFPQEHKVAQNRYLRMDKSRAYFGQIMVYNYIADSILYNRMHDVGYLICRLFINVENHFYVEGLKNLNFTYPDVASNILSDTILNELLNDIVQIALDTDLIMTGFEDSFILSVEEKVEARSIHLGSKPGFRFRSQND